MRALYPVCTCVQYRCQSANGPVGTSGHTHTSAFDHYRVAPQCASRAVPLLFPPYAEMLCNSPCNCHQHMVTRETGASFRRSPNLHTCRNRSILGDKRRRIIPEGPPEPTHEVARPSPASHTLVHHTPAPPACDAWRCACSPHPPRTTVEALHQPPDDRSAAPPSCSAEHDPLRCRPTRSEPLLSHPPLQLALAPIPTSLGSSHPQPSPPT